ncbi:GNAT family N-acetyltransferase [Spirillospora sp. CA-294931]|uniref:GNAT family N-acetyltransferase n=1 Tax=Spirillospora sp. CA-294931 TaxID=3240042 RepID=UPI003D927F9E
MSFPTHVALSGYGLQLREWTDEDVPRLVEIFDEEQIARWTPLTSPFDHDAAVAYLALARQRRARDERIQLAITSDGVMPQGEILLMRAGCEAELGYGVGARHRGQRLATRAVRLMADYAQDVLAFGTVILRIAPENAASVAVAEAAGFALSDDEPVVRRSDIRLLTWRR